MIDSNTGDFTANALGNSLINVTSAVPTGVYNTSQFTIEPWPLHHIVITPIGAENYYIDDTQTYTAIGWNDAEETQMNNTWTPVWTVNDTSFANIDSATGEFIALALGNGLLNVTDSTFIGIYNTSLFIVDPWPLHHIEIIPASSEDHYYVGDMKIYTAIGWNDVGETQKNDSWVPVWGIENTTVGRIWDGDFIAEALGSSLINVSCDTQPEIYATRAFTVHPWPLHHISILPIGPGTYQIGDIVIYSAIGWNDAEETQMNTTWTPVWSLEGEIQEITGEDEEARFEAKKSGEGSIRCLDEDSGIYASSEIIIKEKTQEGLPVLLWILLIVIPLIVCLLTVFLLFLKKPRKNNEGED